MAAFVIAVAHAVQNGDGAEAAYAAARRWARAQATSPVVGDVLDQAAREPPVCDGRSQGWVLVALQNAFHELLRAIASRNGSLGEVKVSEIMVRSPVTATPDMAVNDLRRTMIDSGARYLPVLQDGKLIGVISFRDVAKAVLEEQDFENKMLKGYIKNWPA